MAAVDSRRKNRLTHGQCANKCVTSEWRNYTIAFLALAIIIKISETVRRYFANQQSVSDRQCSHPYI